MWSDSSNKRGQRKTAFHVLWLADFIAAESTRQTPFNQEAVFLVI
ncbi:hypothetical protein CUZ96_2364 [Enterococcus lactis]|uniref:Uncharacterized protein n=1 Tax=Enterococcus faecium 505 TaxID=1134806 RepID=J6Y879_ENTFC|nr:MULTISPECIES: hypothetical protein [Enterococcus]AII40668.1 hypothetical protein M395_11800 [Enterococcus faecium T110]EJY46266.1 hypothetical protein HMPREF1348_01037 [Enterococcus faecium 505]MBL5006961.1 hypothetical protein [Enterococcus lactis]MBL5012697.1 hypothetical protein [Enterococcus lactis]MDO2410273.1 hypothetical protein [Enterococcus faecium]